MECAPKGPFQAKAGENAGLLRKTGQYSNLYKKKIFFSDRTKKAIANEKSKDQ